MSEPREFFLVHRFGWTDGWICNYRDSAERRLQSSLKMPENANEYKIIHVIEKSAYDELRAENEKLKERIGKFGNCLQWIKSGVCGMFGSPSKSWEEEVQDLVPEAIDKVMSEEEWEGIVSCEALRLRDKLDTLTKQNEELKSRSAKLVEALKKVSAKKSMTVYNHSEEFMDGAHTAFCQAAEIADDALADAETFTTDVNNRFITDVDKEGAK